MKRTKTWLRSFFAVFAFAALVVFMTPAVAFAGGLAAVVAVV